MMSFLFPVVTGATDGIGKAYALKVKRNQEKEEENNLFSLPGSTDGLLWIERGAHKSVAFQAPGNRTRNS